MQNNVYAIYDSKAGFHHKPIYAQKHDLMKRECLRLLADERTVINQNPQDFHLVFLGTFEDTTGEFNLLETKEVLYSFYQLLPTLRKLEAERAIQLEEDQDQ